MSDSSGSETSKSQRASSDGSGGGNNRNRNRSRNRGGQNKQQESSKPKVGDSRPAPAQARGGQDTDNRNGGAKNRGDQNRDDRGGRNQGGQSRDTQSRDTQNGGGHNRDAQDGSGEGRRRRRRGGRGRGRGRKPQELANIQLDEATMAKRRGKERDGRPIGRYLMAVHVHNDTRHIAILEGRTLIEYYVSRPTDDVTQIHGNVYMGRVQNVLPGMEAAFIDISTPKNAVLYRGDVQYNPKEFEGTRGVPRIEQMLKAKQMILCQVVKNPIAHKGARLTQEVSLPGRFVVLVPNSDTYGISKRLPDKERQRLRKTLDRIKPKEHGLIVRTAAEDVTDEIGRASCRERV